MTTISSAVENVSVPIIPVPATVTANVDSEIVSIFCNHFILYNIQKLNYI
jgi:hypothetical protein